MKNNFNENVTRNDVEFTCFIIERISRILHQSNQYVIDNIGYDGIEYLLSFACMLHSQNFDQTCNEIIDKYHLISGVISKPNKPTDLYMASVYSNIIWNVQTKDLVDSVISVYNNPICEVIDDYETSAHYEPLPTLVKAYYEGSF